MTMVVHSGFLNVTQGAKAADGKKCFGDPLCRIKKKFTENL